jgi:hypothetical protein
MFISESESSIMKHMKYFGCLLASKLSFPTFDILWKIAVAIVSCCVLAKIFLKGLLFNVFMITFYMHGDFLNILWYDVVPLSVRR